MTVLLQKLLVLFIISTPFSRAQDQCTTSIAAFKSVSNCSDAVTAVVSSPTAPDAAQLAIACGADCTTLWRTAIRHCEPVSYDPCYSSKCTSLAGQSV